MDGLFLFPSIGKEEEERRLNSMYRQTAWQSLRNVVASVFTPLVKEVGRLVFAGGTGVCYLVN